MARLIHGIGRLMTNDPAHGRGPNGWLRDAWVVIDGGLVVGVGDGRPPAADEAEDVGGAAVLPGFVDSHSHLIFAGSRADEFAARLAGQPYRAGGILTTVEATRAESDGQLAANARRLLAEARSTGTTTMEIKTGYGLTVHDEARCAMLGAELSEDVTFLGAHVVPPELTADAYVELVCTTMLDSVVEHCRWIDAFCETGAFDADQCRAILAAGDAAGLGTRLHANQLGHGPGVQLAVELGCASADHCTFLTDADIEALAGSSTVATLLPATEFSTRQPYPDARRLLDAGATVALACNCNPGSSYTTSMPWCIAVAVREMQMTVDEALWAATAGGAAALRRGDVGRIVAGARADLAILTTPEPIDVVYRPGVRYVDRTLSG